MGTVVVVTVPCSAHARPTRSHTWTSWSTVRAPDAACASGYHRSGFSQDGRARRAVHQGGHELALIGHPVEVGAGGGPGADVAERLRPAQFLAARGQVDSGERVADRLGRAHRDAPDGVDRLGEAVETDLGVVVQADSGCLLHGLHEQCRAPEWRMPR